ncbi:MAG: hypothetical protein N3B13_04020, partial [Deltaproteobacteria bacterium]|nr:hypothetical protein [Deltaproteobacteria bacterium]
MKKILITLLIIYILLFSNFSYAKTVKNLIVFLGFDKERKPVIIVIETKRKEISQIGKTDTSYKIKFLNNNNKIQDLYEDSFISDGTIDKLGFRKNFLIKILDQNQIEIGTTGLPYNFNIISLAQKKRATYTKTVNNISFKYYINTAFFGKDGPPQKGNMLFIEAESKSDTFEIPDVIFVTDNLYRSWFVSEFSKNVSAVLFSDSADFFRTASSFKETHKSVSVNMEKGITYNKSVLISIPELKQTLEINSTSEYEEPPTGNRKGARIFVFSEGYSQTRDGMTSIFAVSYTHLRAH